MGVIQLQLTDLALASVLVMLSAALSLALRLGLHRQILWSAIRATVQLSLVGMLLKLVFARDSGWLTTLVIFAMAGLAAREIAIRPSRRLARHGNAWSASIAVAGTALVIALVMVATVGDPAAWSDPRYLIAMVGIVLGSVLNAASLTLESMLTAVRSQKNAIEARLALGETVTHAFSTVLSSSVRRGIIPSINQMSAAGIITLPGIMTGQIIAGMDPVAAVKYQILIMFLLCGASMFSAVCCAFAAMRFLTDDRQRLRLDRLR